MSGILAIVFIGLAFAVMVGMEILGSIVHRRRERLYGIGGTQDIAMWGTFIVLALYIGAAISGLIWILQR